MKISLSTKILWQVNLIDSLKVIKEKGYDGAEIWEYQIHRDIEDLSWFKKYLQQLELGITLHSPNDDINLSSTNNEIRKVSVKQIVESIKLASKLGLKIITIHPGRKTSSKDNLDRIWELQIDSFSQLVKVAEEHDVFLGIENMESRAKEMIIFPKDINRLISDIRSKCVGITLDLAHIATIGSPTVKEYISELQGKIIHAHLSDSNKTTTHLPLGWGSSNLSGMLSDLQKKYDKNVVIEGYVPGKEIEVLENNINIWQKIWKDKKEILN
ncbi:MAG TPA: sugar phosphate isomerase/epimerase [Candidatus Atribacteria bacterium]|nr:sugar phosphate isomerase/epimerase [Candidatus Atribacteria bacterium]